MMVTPADSRLSDGIFNSSSPTIPFSGVVTPSVITRSRFFLPCLLILLNISRALFNASSVRVIPFWYEFLTVSSLRFRPWRSLVSEMASLATWLKSMSPMRLSGFNLSNFSASDPVKSTLFSQFTLSTLPDASSARMISTGELQEPSDKRKQKDKF